jgi:transposase-like protein
MAKRRKYSKELEQEAVQMVSVPGVTLRRVASDLGISEGPLGRV